MHMLAELVEVVIGVDTPSTPTPPRWWPPPPARWSPTDRAGHPAGYRQPSNSFLAERRLHRRQPSRS
jgi:hypothetical protein